MGSFTRLLVLLLLFPAFLVSNEISVDRQTFCPEQPMASLCQNETQQECPKDRDMSGCFHGYYCLPRYIYHDQKCPLKCPPLCRDSEMFCHGAMIGYCPMEDVCVRQVDEITNCPNYCPVTCQDGEYRCVGIRNDEGCRGPDTCVVIGQECPVEIYDEHACPILDTPVCAPDESLCPGGYNAKGCHKKSFCKRLQNKTLEHGINGKDGCPTFCPPVCIPGIETECPETYDEDGCPLPIACKKFLTQCPETKFEPGTGCPVPTVVSNCDQEDKDHKNKKRQICHNEPTRKSILVTSFSVAFNYSSSAFVNGSTSFIEGDPVCDLGNFCADKFDYDSNCAIHCPVYCNNETQKSCPGVMDEQGCLGPGTCVSITEACPVSQYDLNGCFIHDQVTCDYKYETLCPGIRDQRGCVGRDSCIPTDGDCTCPKEEFDEEGCPLDIPEPICESDQITCSKGKSPKGCDLGYECYPSIINGCPAHCPPHCLADKQACPVVTSNTGIYSNCTIMDGYECVDIYDEKGCAVFCSNHCQSIGLLTCPTIYNADGCSTGPPACTHDPGQCAPSPFTSKGCKIFKEIENCTDSDLQLCPGGLDKRGCPRPDTCIPKLTPDNRVVHCPVICGEREMSCSKGTFDGISMGEFCVPADAHSGFMDHIICETLCPAACDWSLQKACSGGYNKMTGCPLPDICVPKDKYCDS